MGNSLTINGGTVTANALDGTGIQGNSLTINGSSVTATGNTAGLKGDNGTCTIGLRKASDFIHVSKYDCAMNIKSGQYLVDENGNIYSGDGSSMWDR